MLRGKYREKRRKGKLALAQISNHKGQMTNLKYLHLSSDIWNLYFEICDCGATYNKNTTTYIATIIPKSPPITTPLLPFDSCAAFTNPHIRRRTSTVFM